MRLIDMDRLDEAFELYNEEKIRKPVPVIFANSEIGKEIIGHWKELGIRCGYIKVPVVAFEDLKIAQEIQGCHYKLEGE